MSIVVEDGTGLVNAVSYCSVVEFKAYWNLVGYDISTYTDTQIEYALTRSTRYLESRFRNKFYGYRQTDSQALSWPRVGVLINCIPVDSTVPTELKNATNEYARRALPATADLQPDPADTDITGQVMTKVRKKIGPIETDIQYQSGGGQVIRAYPSADQWLANLMPSGDFVIRN